MGTNGRDREERLARALRDNLRRRKARERETVEAHRTPGAPAPREPFAADDAERDA